MNFLFRTTSPFRGSTSFNSIPLLLRPFQPKTSMMRGLPSTRSLHTHTHRHAAQTNRKPLAIALGLGSIPFLAPGRPTYNDTSPALSDSALFSNTSGNGAKKDVPVFKNDKLNPDAVKQISFGGILGLGLGVLFSMFSRMLVLLVGVGIVFWQYAARKGYNIIPADRIQRYVKGVDVRRATHDNVAFKISFGLMFALTAFGEF